MDRIAEIPLLRPSLACRYEVVMEGVQTIQVIVCTNHHNSMQDFTTKGGNSVSYFPGPYDVSNIELGCLETDDCAITNFFYEWRAQVYCGLKGQEDLYNLPSVYKREVVIYRMDASHNRIDGFLYGGAWPKSVSPFSFEAATNNAPLLVSVVLSVDSIDRIGPFV